MTLLPAVTLWLAGGDSARGEVVTPLNAPQPLNVPQAVRGTFATGVSDGNIVGGYYPGSGVSGFIYDGTSFALVEFPWQQDDDDFGDLGQ